MGNERTKSQRPYYRSELARHKESFMQREKNEKFSLDKRAQQAHGCNLLARRDLTNGARRWITTHRYKEYSRAILRAVRGFSLLQCTTQLTRRAANRLATIHDNRRISTTGTRVYARIAAHTRHAVDTSGSSVDWRSICMRPARNHCGCSYAKSPDTVNRRLARFCSGCLWEMASVPLRMRPG